MLSNTTQSHVWVSQKRKIHLLLEETPGLKFRLSTYLERSPSSISGVLKKNLFQWRIREQWTDAINDLLGTDYTINDLFSPATDPATDPEPAHS